MNLLSICLHSFRRSYWSETGARRVHVSEEVRRERCGANDVASERRGPTFQSALSPAASRSHHETYVHSTLTRATSPCKPQRCSPFLSNYGRQSSRNSYLTQPVMSRPYHVKQPKSYWTCTTSAKRAESSMMALREHSRKSSKMCCSSALLRAWTTWISSYSTCLNWRRSLFGSPLAAPT
jgi:hypothetical protein